MKKIVSVVSAVMMLAVGSLGFSETPQEVRFRAVAERMNKMVDILIAKQVEGFSEQNKYKILSSSRNSWEEVVKGYGLPNTYVFLDEVSYTAGAPTYSNSYYLNPRKLGIKYGDKTVSLMWMGMIFTDMDLKLNCVVDSTITDGYKGPAVLCYFENLSAPTIGSIDSIDELSLPLENVCKETEAEWAKNHPGEPTPF